jgi:nitroreductase
MKAIPKEIYAEEMKPTSAEAFDHIVQNRRSVRVYTAESVPEEVVNRALQWGPLAPNSSNLQAWAFYRIVDPKKKQLMVEAALDQPAARTAPELIVAVAKLNHWKPVSRQMIAALKANGLMRKSVMAYYSKVVPLAYTQGPFGAFGFLKKIAVTVMGFFRPVPRQPTSRADMRVWAVKSTALACENIMLGFSAQGYDSCPMEGYDSSRVKKILNLGSDSEVVMIISAGKRDPRGVYGPRIRMPSEQFIFTV